MTRYDIEQTIAQIFSNSQSPSHSSKFSSKAIGHSSIPIPSGFKGMNSAEQNSLPKYLGNKSEIANRKLIKIHIPLLVSIFQERHFITESGKDRDFDD